MHANCSPRLQLLVTQAHLHHPRGRVTANQMTRNFCQPNHYEKSFSSSSSSQLGHRVTFVRQMLGSSCSFFLHQFVIRRIRLRGSFFFSFRALQLWMHILRGSVSWQINRPQKYFAETSEPETLKYSSFGHQGVG